MTDKKTIVRVGFSIDDQLMKTIANALGDQYILVRAEAGEIEILGSSNPEEKWTKSPPTEMGWFWVRQWIPDEKTGVITVPGFWYEFVTMVFKYDGHLVFGTAGGYVQSGRVDAEEHKDLFWSGPLDKPEGVEE